MYFGLTEEQQLLQETARAFVDKHCPPEKAKEWDETDHFPADVWEKMNQMGLVLPPFPEDWGGGGGTPWICASSPRRWGAPAWTWP